VFAVSLADLFLIFFVVSPFFIEIIQSWNNFLVNFLVFLESLSSWAIFCKISHFYRGLRIWHVSLDNFFIFCAILRVYRSFYINISRETLLILKTLVKYRFTDFIFLGAWRHAKFLSSLLTVSHCWASNSSANLKLTFSKVEHIFSTSGLPWRCFYFNLDNFLLFKRSLIIIIHFLSAKDPLKRRILVLHNFSFHFLAYFHLIFFHFLCTFWGSSQICCALIFLYLN